MYSLEQHLQAQGHTNPQFAVLHSIWTLNKKFLPNAQNAISFNFPHYSLHETSHSESIIKNIELFLGEDRIKRLSPTDTWLILMSAYTHDLGMVVFNEVLEKELGEKFFREYLISLSNKSYDNDLRNSADLLLKVSDLNSTDKESNFLAPLEIRRALIAIIADYFRKSHHERSREMILGNDTSFYKEVNGFNMTGVPNRFSVILAEVAYSHGIDFYAFIDRLEYIADGYGNDRMHPRFIAALLRLGDLLDVDDKRFNIFINRAFANQLPKISGMHYEKHASVNHLLISPNSIEVTVDCKSSGVYREARSWFDLLQKEVEDQSREWANIAPSELLGMPPTISRGKIKILYQSVQPKPELLNLRFSISTQKVFEIFEGSAIYDNVGSVFLRELIQNSLDASKIQLWKMINSGIYDHLIKRSTGLSLDATHDEVIESIKFPSDIPGSLWDQFIINLNIDWKDEKKDTIKVEIRDSGTGISEKSLIRMTSKVGESRSLDEEFLSLKKDMPYWLKPTGAFGIGLQSLFLITNTFTIRTRADSEESKEINFYSAKNGQYCQISKTGFEFNRGTYLELEFSMDKLSEMYGSSFEYNLVDSYDHFTDKYKNMYMHKILSYIENEFSRINILQVRLFKETVKKFNDENQLNSLFFSKREGEERDEKLLVKYTNYGEYYGDDAYKVYENIAIGSELLLYFKRKFPIPGDHGGFSTFSNSYLVRNIPVNTEINTSWSLGYLGLIWNFESPESDKILKISRDKFIAKSFSDYRNKLSDEILPKVLKKVINIFEKYRHSTNDYSDAVEYFFTEITAKMFNININSLPSIYGSFTIPKYIATKFNESKISFSEFFECKQIVTLSINKTISKVPNIALTNKGFRQIVKEKQLSADIIYWEPDLFQPYLNKMKYQLSCFYAKTYKDDTVFLRKYEISNKYIFVDSNEVSRSIFFKHAVPDSEHTSRRSLLIPLDIYSPLICVKPQLNKMYFSGSLGLCSHYIISPFNSKGDLDLILNFIQMEIHMTKDQIKTLVYNYHIRKLVPDSLIDYILENGSIENKEALNRESILMAYLDLATDIVLAHLPKEEKLLN